METIGERIAKVRKELNLNQRELCKMADITEVSLSRYENGSRMPKAEVLARLAEVLNVSTDYLIGITDEKNTELQALNNMSKDAEDLYDHAEKFLKRDGVMFSGKPISEKNIKQILRSIEFGLSMIDEE